MDGAGFRVVPCVPWATKARGMVGTKVRHPLGIFGLAKAVVMGGLGA